MDIEIIKQHIERIEGFKNSYRQYQRELHFAKNKKERANPERYLSLTIAQARQYLTTNSPLMFFAYNTTEGFNIRVILDEIHNRFIDDMDEIIDLLKKRIEEI